LIDNHFGDVLAAIGKRETDFDEAGVKIEFMKVSNELNANLKSQSYQANSGEF
jgi:hypothetical protein